MERCKSFFLSCIKKDYSPFLKRCFSYSWLIALILIAFIKPESFAHMPFPFPLIDTVLLFLKIISIPVVFILYILQKKPSKIILSILSFLVLLFIMTAIYRGDFRTFLTMYLPILAICMLVELLLNFALERMMRIFTLILVLWTTINLFTVIVFPQGMYEAVYKENYFLGFRTLQINILFPAIGFSMLYEQIKYGKLRWLTVIVLAFSITTFTLTKSTASLVCSIILLAILLVVYNKPSFTRFFNFASASCVNALLFVALVIFRVHEHLLFLVQSILHKDISLNGRTNVWDGFLYYIQKSPLFGYGLEYKETTVEKVSQWTGGLFTLNHAHNQYLNILYQTGIVGLIIFALILFLAGRRLMKYRKSPYSILLTGVLFSFMVSMQTDVYEYAILFYAMLVIAYHLPKLMSIQKQKGQISNRPAKPLPENKNYIQIGYSRILKLICNKE